MEPSPVETSEQLAERFESGAQFIEGSFVPLACRDEVDLLESDYMTPAEGADAYGEMGPEIADFDQGYGECIPACSLRLVPAQGAGPGSLGCCDRGGRGRQPQATMPRSRPPGSGQLRAEVWVVACT